MTKKALNIFWYDFLEELLTFCLDILFNYYDAEDDSFGGAAFKKLVESELDQSKAGKIDLQPIYYELVKTLDEPGYPPYDPKQDSPFESMLICLHDLDRDRFYDLHRAVTMIYDEDSFIPSTIIRKDAFVYLLNEFADAFLEKNSGHTHIYNTNGSVGREFKI